METTSRHEILWAIQWWKPHRSTTTFAKPESKSSIIITQRSFIHNVRVPVADAAQIGETYFSLHSAAY